MRTAPIPANEDRRVGELHDLGILDTEPERDYDDLVRIASSICGTPIGLVSFIDRDRQWFKARLGIDAVETPRDVSFCAHAINDPSNLMLVPDATLDPRFSDNPHVTGEPHVRFYAGAPLLTSSGNALGTLCVIDHQPRTLEPFQREALLALARQVAVLLELRRTARRLHHQLVEREWYEARLKLQQQELERANADLAEQTRTDPLTGLANRRALEAGLATAIAAAGGADKVPVLLRLAVDEFKSLNELHGHAEGDRALVAVAQLLQTNRGASGVAARVGGDEFALLWPATSAISAEFQCEYLREAVATELGVIGGTISIGIAGWRAGETPEALWSRAEAALQSAKGRGRNQLEVAR